MNNEERRLQSFLRSWPHSHYGFNPTPIKLSKSGFFHSPTPSFPDRVVCFCCGIALVHWNAHHDPWFVSFKKKTIIYHIEATKLKIICGTLKGLNMLNVHQLVD